jgi:hypothetical protein
MAGQVEKGELCAIEQLTTGKIMETFDRLKQMENEVQPESEADEVESAGRRRFLRGLGKWSMAVIGAVALGAAAPSEGAAWINRRGGWLNRGGWHGGGWVNRGGGWLNAGGGGGWANAVHGGGWLNRRGGGGWLNHR